jgi:hypothetical protein
VQRREQKLATALQDLWAGKFGHQSAADAFGLNIFLSEADLDRTQNLQRDRRFYGARKFVLDRTWLFGRWIPLPKFIAERHLDFRDRSWFLPKDTPVKIVRLHGGPYNGRTAAVWEGQRSAFVVMDHTYEAPRHPKDEGRPWTWHYDSFG